MTEENKKKQLILPERKVKLNFKILFLSIRIYIFKNYYQLFATRLKTKQKPLFVALLLHKHTNKKQELFYNLYFYIQK